MTTRKKYDRDFKENAVKLSYQRDNLITLSRELGITSKLLSSWRSEFRKKGAESFPGNGNMVVSDQAKSELHLRKENERLQKENDILKKALGIISRSDL